MYRNQAYRASLIILLTVVGYVVVQHAVLPGQNTLRVGRITASAMQYNPSARMYEGSISYILPNGSTQTITNICSPHNPFTIGTCYRINQRMIPKIRNRTRTSALLNGCYIPDNTTDTLQHTQCPDR